MHSCIPVSFILCKKSICIPSYTRRTTTKWPSLPPFSPSPPSFSPQLRADLRGSPGAQQRAQNSPTPRADQNIDFEDGEVSCEGVNEEECLMRRTLVAHVDYIYTQKHKKP
ncbi:hypothetical protein ACLB2K_018912 [Fragaria x ananassa]